MGFGTNRQRWLASLWNPIIHGILFLSNYLDLCLFWGICFLADHQGKYQRLLQEGKPNEWGSLPDPIEKKKKCNWPAWRTHEKDNLWKGLQENPFRVRMEKLWFCEASMRREEIARFRLLIYWLVEMERKVEALRLVEADKSFPARPLRHWTMKFKWKTFKIIMSV